MVMFMGGPGVRFTQKWDGPSFSICLHQLVLVYIIYFGEVVSYCLIRTILITITYILITYVCIYTFFQGLLVHGIFKLVLLVGLRMF